MKNLLAILLLAFSISANAQITKIENENFEEVYSFQKYISILQSGDTYMVQYKDMKYTQIADYKSFIFKDVDNAFDYLKESLYKCIQSGEEIKLELPNDVVILTPGSSFGQNYVEIYHRPKGADVVGKSMWLTEKRLDKLFK